MTTPSTHMSTDTTAWRVGTHYGIHVYEGDRPVATFHRAEDAARAVEAHNALPALRDLIAERDQAVAAVERVRILLPLISDGGSVSVHHIRRALDEES